MSLDKVISWLIHSDWVLVGTWILVLGVALVFVSRPSRPGDSGREGSPPLP